MKKLLALTGFVGLALTGCNTPNHIEGTLALNAAINVNATSWGKIVKTPLAAGRYSTSLAMQNDGAEVHIHTQQGTVAFAVPSIKADQLGNVNMSAQSLGQDFALQGKIFDSVDGIDRNVSESCVHHYDQEYKCHDENCCDRDGNNCHRENKCDWEQVPVYGSEPVHEVGDQTTKNVTINLVKGGKVVGRFTGGYSYNENIRSREVVGGCTL
jgi:hypothetical protein